MNLISNTAFRRVLDAQAVAGTSTTTTFTGVIDMKGCQGCTFLVSLNDMANAAVIAATAQGGALADGSDAADLSGAVATYTASSATAGDKKLIAVEVFRPRKRYVRLKIVRSVADTSLDCVITLKSGPPKAVVTQGADVLASSVTLSPA